MNTKAVTVLLSLFAAFAARATPPSQPQPTLQEQVGHGCRSANVVAIARLSKVDRQRGPDWETRSATLQALRMLKGEASQLPPRIHEHVPDVLPTDSEPPQFHEGWTYLMFFDVPQAPGYRLLVPQATLGDDFEALVAQARAQCGNSTKALP